MTELSVIHNENLRDIYEKNAENLIELYTSPGYMAVLPESYEINFDKSKEEKFIKREKDLLNNYISANKKFIESEPDGGYYLYLYRIMRKAALNDNYRKSHKKFIESEPDGEYYPYAYNKLTNKVFGKTF